MEAAASIRLDLNKMQTTNFFTSSKQMEVVKEALVQLGKEGIKEVEDLAEFNKDIWKQVAENLKRLGGWMKNPMPRFLKPCIFWGQERKKDSSRLPS
eukprot:3276630-Ditylum_brightwellii.AAC.1